MKDAEGRQGWGELDVGIVCKGWAKKSGIMTTSSKEVSVVEVTSRSVSIYDCCFESNTCGNKKTIFSKHTPVKSRP